MSLPAFNVAEVRQAARELESLGFEYKGMGKGTHPKFEHPEYGKTSLALTPTNPHQWLRSFRGGLARQMGITGPQLYQRLGLEQARKRNGPKVRRERNDAGRQARRFEIVRDVEPKQPARVGTPQERMAEIARDRKEAEGRQARAAVGSDAYRCALDDISRCRREWLEAEIAMKGAA